MYEVLPSFSESTLNNKQCFYTSYSRWPYFCFNTKNRAQIDRLSSHGKSKITVEVNKERNGRMKTISDVHDKLAVHQNSTLSSLLGSFFLLLACQSVISASGEAH